MIEAEVMERGDGAREGEGEDCGNIRPGLDPFLQPPILKAFFEVLPLEELANCRLVSKLWYEESLSTWRSNTTLKFGKEGIVSTADDGSEHTTSLGEFLDLWDAGDWGSCPFRKFELYSWTFEAEDVKQQRFLKLVGGHITSLILEDCSFVGRDNFRRTIYRAFPKLQFLKMDCCDVDEDGYYNPGGAILAYKEPAFGVHSLKSLNLSWCLPDSMMDMLSHFHRVKSLIVAVDADARGPAFYRDLLEAIRLIRAQDHTKLPLKNFEVDFEFGLGKSTASSIKLLKLHEQLNLTLQWLEIYFDPEEDEDIDWNFSDVIRDILQNHSSTLKHLEFSGELGEGAHGLCNSFPFGFYLQNLEELVMPPGFSDNLNYLRYTPKLRVLDLKDFPSESVADNLFYNSTELEIGDWTLPSLRDLGFGFFGLSLSNLKKLMKWMPNMERLGRPSGTDTATSGISVIALYSGNLE